MQAKITTGVVMTPQVHRKLKLLAARRGRTIGDCLAALLAFESLAPQIGDSEKRAFVNSVLDALFRPVETAWGDEELSESPSHPIGRVRFGGEVEALICS